MKLLTIINPTAGHGKVKRQVPELLRLYKRHDLDGRIFVSENAEHVRQLAEDAVRDKVDCVAVCGGDGTLHHAVNALRDSPTALGILPMGSGNDLAKALGIPLDLEASVAVLRHGRARTIDLAETGSCVYACIAGVGFDSAVVKVANDRRFWLRGPMIYSYAVFRTLFTYRPKLLRLTHDGGTYEGRVMFAVVGNTRQYGGGMRVVPDADPEDGLLDVCIVKELSALELVKQFPKVFRGAHTDLPYVTMLRSRTVELESDESLEVYADGEFLENTPLRIRVRPRALRVIAPPSTPSV